MCGIFASITASHQHFTKKCFDGIYQKYIYDKIKHRGPDSSATSEFQSQFSYIFLAFHRLAINGLSPEDGQPMQLDDTYLICNGEIYNYKQLAKDYGFTLKSKNDCEIILHLYNAYGIEHTVKELDGEFAFILYDHKKDCLIATRDFIGVKPLFADATEDGLFFASEAKSLLPVTLTAKNSYGYGTGTHVELKPGFIWQVNSKKYKEVTSDNFEKYYWPNKIEPNHFQVLIKDHPMACYAEPSFVGETGCLLISAVQKRTLMSDRKVGFFLSGGLDSSLIASIGAKQLAPQKIETFSIGTHKDSPDLKAARIVAQYLGSNHHEVIFSPEEGFAIIPEVIYHLETYDVTTVRASVPMFLLSKFVKENTDIKVILSGEGSDELFGGYLYFHNAPSEKAFQAEVLKLQDQLYLFDVRRAERTTAAHGLELRPPFLDHDFRQFVNSLPASVKTPKTDKLFPEKGIIEKHFLRSIFKDFLPKEILWRTKNGMSDAVGYDWVDYVRQHIPSDVQSRVELADNRQYGMVFNQNKTIELYHYSVFKEDKTLEAKYYHLLFIQHIYNSCLFSHYWMPNWVSKEITDPSARVLPIFNQKIT